MQVKERDDLKKYFEEALGIFAIGSDKDSFISTEKAWSKNLFLGEVYDSAPDDNDVKGFLNSIILKDDKTEYYIPKDSTQYNQIYGNINTLKKAISKILVKYAFDKKTADSLADDIVWDEDFFLLFLIKYSNLVAIKKSYLDKYTKDSFAEKIYKRYLLLSNKERHDSFYLDGECSTEILSNNKILNTIVYIGEDIYNFFNICNKISFTFYNFIHKSSNNFINISEIDIWYLTKGLIKYLSLDDFNSNEVLVFKMFENIEANLDINVTWKMIMSMIGDGLIIDGLKKAIEWKSKDFYLN